MALLSRLTSWTRGASIFKVGDSTIVRNVGYCLQLDTALHERRHEFEQLLFCCIIFVMLNFIFVYRTAKNTHMSLVNS